MEVLDALKTLVKGSNQYIQVLELASGSIPGDVRPVIMEGLGRVREIIFAKAFTRYAWLLVVYETLGRVEDDRLIIYYNREPRWTVSVLIHELAHLGLSIEHKNTFDVIVDESLAYAASFKSGFLDLYYEGNKRIVDLLSSCENPYSIHELAYIVIPRILASRLTIYDYRELVNIFKINKHRIVELWLNTDPSESEALALAVALEKLNLNINYKFKSYYKKCSEIVDLERKDEIYQYEGVDDDYIKMIEILREAARRRDKAYEILKPWWDELKLLKVELSVYLELYGNE